MRAPLASAIQHVSGHGSKPQSLSSTIRGRRDVISSSSLLLASFCSPAPSYAAVATGVPCPGLNGYTLSKCLRSVRLAREAQQEAGVPANGGSGREAVQDLRIKSKQYEQPGTLVTLPSGLQYREIVRGSGQVAELGATCEIQYTVYRLSSGAYFKYSSGATPVLLYALGFGFEGQKDDGEVYRFTLGDPQSLPAAATPAVVGMREGGTRRILVPPQLGWVSDQVGGMGLGLSCVRCVSQGACHKEVAPFHSTSLLLIYSCRTHLHPRDEPLLFEVFLARVRPSTRGQQQQQTGTATAFPEEDATSGVPFKLPMPLNPFLNKVS